MHAPSTTAIRDFDSFRESVSELFLPVRVHPVGDGPFWGASRHRALDEVHISEISASRHIVERTADLIDRGPRPHYKISYQVSGHALLVQNHRDTVLRPGDLAVYDTDSPYTLTFDDDFQILIVSFPQDLIELPPALVRGLTARRVDGTSGIAGVVVPYLRRLSATFDDIPGPAGSRLMRSTLDLVTTMLANELQLASGGTERVGLLLRIQSFIESQLSSPRLSPADVAAAHHISVSHLHGLFREQGTTVSEWIRTRRLEHCHRDLVDPLLAHRPVADIAARWGFVDAPHFCRVFKAAFGATPTAVRASARTA